jgi:hypothetical protein
MVTIIINNMNNSRLVNAKEREKRIKNELNVRKNKIIMKVNCKNVTCGLYETKERK